MIIEGHMPSMTHIIYDEVINEEVVEIDKHMKFIIAALAGWLLFSISSSSSEFIASLSNYPNLGLILFPIINFFRGVVSKVIVFIQIIGLATVFTFAIPIVISSWKELIKKK